MQDALHKLYFQTSGHYDSLSWQTFLRGDAHSPYAQMVSLHEGFHADLDRTTDYGSLLAVYAFLATNLSDEPHYTNVFNQLVKYCKRTHETFATYLSVFLLTTNDPAAWAELEPALLDYLPYQQTGERLAQGCLSPYLRFHVVISALRVCMQGPVTQTATATGLAHFRLRDLGVRNYPDERLRAIEQVLAAHPQFWLETIATVQRLRPDWTIWQEIAASEHDPAIFHALLEAEHTETSAFLMSQFQAALAAALRDFGMASLPYDGHIPLVAPILSAAEALIGERNTIGYHLIAAENLSEQFDERVSTVMNFADERLVIQEQPAQATLYQLADGALDDWLELTSSSGEHEHFFLVTRLAERLLAQYTWSDVDRAALGQLGATPVCYLQRSGSRDGTRIVELFLCQQPTEIVTLAEGLNRQLPVICNLSLATLAEPTWTTGWLATIGRYTDPVILFDLPPFHHFALWQKENRFSVRYGLINLHDAEQTFAAFACKLPDAVLPWPLIAPCSLVVAKALQIYITEMLPEPHQFCADDGFIHADADKLNYTLTHLLRTERFFDFNASRGKVLSF